MMVLGYAFNKKWAQDRHAARRAKERYGIELMPAHHSKVGSAINSGSVKGNKYEFSKYHVFQIDWKMIDSNASEMLVWLAFNKSTQMIVTFLPRDWTPEKGLEVHTENKMERIMRFQVAKEETDKIVLKRAVREFNEVHPVPAMTTDPLHDDQVMLRAIGRLQNDRDRDPTFLLMRKDRLEQFRQIESIFERGSRPRGSSIR